MTNSVPDRWLKYKSFGNVIEGTNILAFKVPLKDAIAKNLQPQERFTTTILLEAFPRLKYIIDLTNTCRYYDKKEFTNAGVKYEKIAIPGRKVPSMDLIKEFFKVMDDFMATCGDGELIGVHCTHGVNRTGYLICRYLIQQLGWVIQDSLKAFGDARGYPIERDIYLSALKELQCGKRIDTSKVVLRSKNPTAFPTKKNSRSLKNLTDRSMGPSGFAMSRRSFANGGPFSPQRFAGPPPGFGPMPPPPLGMPPIPPPMGPPLYGPRPFRYGPPPMRPAMPPTPPGPGGFPHPGFPPRMPGLPRMAGPSRLPVGPVARLPPPKMPPPPPPPPPLLPSRTVVKQLHGQKKKQQIRNSIMERVINIRLRRNGPASRIMPKVHKEQDFTVDTFEENLLTTSITAQSRRQTKGRFNQTK
ncbi:RNA/RNP complex-1-interacting phosphatase [Polyergus mexicanus]|uniref:RNA/RNP complex-1-interacting phosphatase n=1 Tax=Polyergus mexicanus TaxID=615972 RepID=UPI0038B46AF8